MHLHLRHQHAGLIAVERLLHELMHGGLDVLTRAGENGLNFRAADNFAHRAFSNRFDGAFGLFQVEQKFARPSNLRADHPEHREIDVDDVFIAGEHQALFRHIAHGRAAARVFHETHADVHAIGVQCLWCQRALDGIREMVIQARLNQPIVLAEPQDHADLVRLHDEETGEAP